jgi:hypothetical protein
LHDQPSTTIDRRNSERIEHQRSIQLKLENGTQLTGITRDVSLGGVCFYIYQPVQREYLHQICKLYIKGVDGTLSPEFSCRIIRYESNRISVKLNKEQLIAFGRILTHGLFVRKYQ